MNYNVYIFCGCSFVVSVLSHAVTYNELLERRGDQEREQTLICNNHCPFGFLPDVEGKLTCKCFDPCRNILCLQGTVCVARMQENCLWQPCRAVANCEEESTAVHAVNKDEYWLKFPVIQQDDPDQWWNSGSDVDKCAQSLPMAAVDCKHKRRRWYFNPMTGKCERFMGCVTAGNNFGRKIFCKEQCRYPYIQQREARRASKKQELQNTGCSLALNEKAYDCQNKTKRWYFNSKTKSCEKFFGCKTTGNNFSRKSFCKSACLARNKHLFISTDTRIQDNSPR